jgi:hypothetical protein
MADLTHKNAYLEGGRESQADRSRRQYGGSVSQEHRLDHEDFGQEVAELRGPVVVQWWCGVVAVYIQ